MKSYQKIAGFIAKTAVCLPLVSIFVGCGLQEKSKKDPAPTVTPSGNSVDANGNPATGPCNLPIGGYRPADNTSYPNNNRPNVNNGSGQQPWGNEGPNPWENPDGNGQPGPWGYPNGVSGPSVGPGAYEGRAPWEGADENGGPPPWENGNGGPPPWGYPAPSGNGPVDGDGPWNWGGPEAPVFGNANYATRSPATGRAPTSASSGSYNTQPNPCPPRVQNSGLDAVRSRPSFPEVSTAISKSCSGAECHSSGSRYGSFVGNQSAIEAAKSRIYNQVASGRMPKFGGLSTQDKNLILSYTRP